MNLACVWSLLLHAEPCGGCIGETSWQWKECAYQAASALCEMKMRLLLHRQPASLLPRSSM